MTGNSIKMEILSVPASEYRALQAQVKELQRPMPKPNGSVCQYSERDLASLPYWYGEPRFT